MSEEQWWKFRVRLQLALVFAALTVAGAGVVLQIAHVAKPSGSVLLFVGILG